MIIEQVYVLNNIRKCRSSTIWKGTRLRVLTGDPNISDIYPFNWTLDGYNFFVVRCLAVGSFSFQRWLSKKLFFFFFNNSCISLIYLFWRSNEVSLNKMVGNAAIDNKTGPADLIIQDKEKIRANDGHFPSANLIQELRAMNLPSQDGRKTVLVIYFLRKQPNSYCMFIQLMQLALTEVTTFISMKDNAPTTNMKQKRKLSTPNCPNCPLRACAYKSNYPKEISVKVL